MWAQPDTGVQLNEGIPAQAEGVTVDQHLGTRLPLDEQVVDSSGHTVTLEHYFDGQRPVIVTLNYSDCPMLCSVQLNALSRTLNEMDLDLGNDFRVLTVSIDPNEKPERSRETQQLYVDQVPDQPRAGEAWHFATASESTIEKLTDALGFRYRFDKITKEYNHPAMLAFVSPEGVITSYSLRVDFPVEDMKRSLIAAGDGTIGSPVDRIIMWCLSYDPDRGRYVAVAWKLMRLGGALTVAVILLGLTPYWIGKRRKSLTGAEANEDQETSATDGGADE
ncbi:SCO family protein [Roseimaritima sediminicola]|uniref:SCO family protein n=1 Tax=Roseimaritima sediminicola TaxID=2662066 RepID=UPI001298563E|nr:SCO family protein [Roseimaritima sediminicola]